MVKKITLLKNLVQRLYFSKDYYVVGQNIYFLGKNYTRVMQACFLKTLT
jgi:hypothetical protein